MIYDCWSIYAQEVKNLGPVLFECPLPKWLRRKTKIKPEKKTTLQELYKYTNQRTRANIPNQTVHIHFCPCYRQSGYAHILWRLSTKDGGKHMERIKEAKEEEERPSILLTAIQLVMIGYFEAAAIAY